MSTGFQQNRDGIQLFYRLSPVSEPQGSVLIIHGFAEHSQRYGHVIQELNNAGFSTAAIDLRGHGSSEGSRGFVGSFSEYLEDVETGCQIVADHLGDAPLFILGHSMGGLVVANYAAENPEGLAGIILSAPAMAFAVQVPGWKRALGEVMSKYMPHFSIPAGVQPQYLSHDTEIVAAYEKDPMVFGSARARWYTETLAAQQLALEASPFMNIPLLIQVGGDDRIVDSPTGVAFYERYQGEDKTLHVYEGFYHEIYNETKREKPLSDLKIWLKNR